MKSILNSKFFVVLALCLGIFGCTAFADSGFSKPEWANYVVSYNYGSNYYVVCYMEKELYFTDKYGETDGKYITYIVNKNDRSFEIGSQGTGNTWSKSALYGCEIGKDWYNDVYIGSEEDKDDSDSVIPGEEEDKDDSDSVIPGEEEDNDDTIIIPGDDVDSSVPGGDVDSSIDLDISDSVKTIPNDLINNLKFLVPMGIGLLALFVGVSLIPRIVYKFL